MKLKQTGGCIGFDCFGYKNSKKREDNSIVANIFIYVNDGIDKNFDFKIDKDKPFLETKNAIFEFLKDEFEFFEDEIKYFYEPDIKITFGGEELQDLDAQALSEEHNDMADGAVIKIYFNLKKITCALCGKQDDIDSNDYVYKQNKQNRQTKEYHYAHYTIKLCLKYQGEKEELERQQGYLHDEREKERIRSEMYEKKEKIAITGIPELSALDREKRKPI